MALYASTIEQMKQNMMKTTGELFLYRKFNSSLPPIIYISGRHIAGNMVTPPMEGPSTSLKATQAMRGTEEALPESIEELRVIHNDHSELAPRAHEYEDKDENCNPQLRRRATSTTMWVDQVLSDNISDPCCRYLTVFLNQIPTISY